MTERVRQADNKRSITMTNSTDRTIPDIPYPCGIAGIMNGRLSEQAKKLLTVLIKTILWLEWSEVEFEDGADIDGNPTTKIKVRLTGVKRKPLSETWTRTKDISQPIEDELP